MSVGGGGVVSPLESCSSASWIRPSPWLAVMFEPVVSVAPVVCDAVLLGLEALGEVLAGLRVERRPASAVVRALQLQSLGRAGGVVGGRERVVDDRDRLGELVRTQPVGSNASHLLLTLPSIDAARRSRRRVLGAGRDRHDLVADVPGIPGDELPVTPDIFLLPCESTSAVFSHAGAGSPLSNDE
jgi:hypothetical protein